MDAFGSVCISAHGNFDISLSRKVSLPGKRLHVYACFFAPPMSRKYSKARIDFTLLA